MLSPGHGHYTAELPSHNIKAGPYNIFCPAIFFVEPCFPWNKPPHEINQRSDRITIEFCTLLTLTRPPLHVFRMNRKPHKARTGERFRSLRPSDSQIPPAAFQKPRAEPQDWPPLRKKRPRGSPRRSRPYASFGITHLRPGYLRGRKSRGGMGHGLWLMAYLA